MADEPEVVWRHAGPQTEAEFQRWVLQVADQFGWRRRYHTYRSRKSQTGFPDWVFVHPNHGVIFVELKSPTGKPTADQQAWHDELRQAGARAFIWRPADASTVVSVFAGRLYDPASGRSPQ